MSSTFFCEQTELLARGVYRLFYINLVPTVFLNVLSSAEKLWEPGWFHIWCSSTSILRELSSVNLAKLVEDRNGNFWHKSHKL